MVERDPKVCFGPVEAGARHAMAKLKPCCADWLQHAAAGVHLEREAPLSRTRIQLFLYLKGATKADAWPCYTPHGAVGTRKTAMETTVA